MNSQKISELEELPLNSIDDEDLFPLVDTSETETKNTTFLSLLGKIKSRLVGVPSGAAPLGSDSFIPLEFIPVSLLGALRYQATWNAATNVPAIPAASASNRGWYYRVGVAGTTPISGISDWGVGDWLVSNGTSWDKIDNSEINNDDLTTTAQDPTDSNVVKNLRTVLLNLWGAIGNRAPKGAIAGSGLTMATGKLLGRSTAASGAVEEITLGTGLSLSGDTLNASGGTGALALPRAKPSGGSNQLSVPGVDWIATATRTPGTGSVYYMPFRVGSPISVAALYCEITTAGGAGSTARLGIYNADGDWQPTTLVVDGGTCDTSTTGTKSVSVAATLAAGNYLIALSASSATTQVTALRGAAGWAGLSPALGANRWNIEWKGTQTYGALPSTGTTWTILTSSSIGFMYPVTMDWSPA